MPEMLTGTPWLAVLSRLKLSGNDTSRILASALYDILSSSTDPVVGEIMDTYARRLLGSLS